LILYDIVGSEDHPAYQELEISNGNRQYDFLRSMVVTSLAVKKPFISQAILKALNFQAIACLHSSAGQFRPCPVEVGDYHPPQHYLVPDYVEDFVNTVNREWDATDAVYLSAFVLWKLNHIHPFINGNGRTARAACYFVLCVKAGGWLPGDVILPELLRRNRHDYVRALKDADGSLLSGGLDISSLHKLISALLDQQLSLNEVGSMPDGT
jgi:Fic family protein